jgi:hypothetical protein
MSDELKRVRKKVAKALSKSVILIDIEHLDYPNHELSQHHTKEREMIANYGWTKALAWCLSTIVLEER